MTELLPPFHQVMHSTLECDLANDRVAVLEAELAALKARRCETCEHGNPVFGSAEEPRVYCGRLSMWWETNDCCNHWAVSS